MAYSSLSQSGNVLHLERPSMAQIISINIDDVTTIGLVRPFLGPQTKCSRN